MEDVIKVKNASEAMLRHLTATQRTLASVVNIPSADTAKQLQQRLQHHGDVVVFTETLTTPVQTIVNLKLGKKVATEDGSTRNKATCEVITTTTESHKHRALVMVSNRQGRKNAERITGVNMRWLLVSEMVAKLNEGGVVVDGEPTQGEVEEAVEE